MKAREKEKDTKSGVGGERKKQRRERRRKKEWNGGKVERKREKLEEGRKE